MLPSPNHPNLNASICGNSVSFSVVPSLLQQTSSCFGGLPDVTEHTHNKNGKRLCKFNKQQLPPLLETLTSNESLPSSPSLLASTAQGAAQETSTLTKQRSFDIFDTKPSFFPSDALVSRPTSALSLSHPKALPEALLSLHGKGLSPTGSLKYGMGGGHYNGSGYCSPASLADHSSGRGGLGICGLTTLRLNAKSDNSSTDGMLVGATNLYTQYNHHQMQDMKAGLQDESRRGSRKSSSITGKESLSSGAQGDRRWCLFLVTIIIALTVCVVVVSFVLEVLLGDRFVDKSTEDFRLKTIRLLLRETPLIGE